jgi:hypothetical protein
VISKRIKGRKDGKSSCADALRYGEGLSPDHETGELLDKSHRTRLGNFGLVDDGVYIGHDVEYMAGLIKLAAIEMQSTCDLNTRVGIDKRLAHFVVSFNQNKPSEAVLRDTEDSMLSAMKLDKNHFATFTHSDNGFYHLHIFASRISKDKPYRGNPLWQDQTIRDKCCREIELRHGLVHDNGMHEIDNLGQIVEIPRDVRRAKRDAKPTGISDRARTTEIYSGEQSFQSWCNQIRIGDRLKHAKSWQDLHTAAAAYGCEVRQKGAGFVICPIGEKGGIQLSKIGLKNLPSKFGVFESAKLGQQAIQGEATYKPSPTIEKAASHYDRWRKAKNAFKPIHTEQMNEQRETHKIIRSDLRSLQRAELEKVRSNSQGEARFAAVSVAKMEHTFEQSAISEQFARERQALRRQLAAQGPGNTFRDYLVREAGKGDSIALGLARKYGVGEATDVLRVREADRLKAVATITGLEYRPAQRLNFTHRVERSGTVVFDLGQGRKIIDSAISKQVLLNDLAANSPEAIATALHFAASKFGNTLVLTGSTEFQHLAVETAVLKGIGVKFADPTLEAYRDKFAVEQKRITTPIKEKYRASYFTKQQTERIPPAHLRDRLHYLSDGDLVLNSARDVSLLQQNVRDRVGQLQAGENHGMQRTASGHLGDASAREYTNDDPANPRNSSVVTTDNGHSTNGEILRTDRKRGRVGKASKLDGLSLNIETVILNPITPDIAPIIQTPEERLQAKILSIDPRAKFVIPDPLNNHRLYIGQVIASLDTSDGTEIGFAQRTGRGTYTLHMSIVPENHRDTSVEVRYHDRQAVATIPDRPKEKGRVD